MERRIAAVLATDVVGYSRLMGIDETGTLARLQRHREDLFTPKARQYSGRVVKLMGDGMLMEFASVVDAVSFAADIQIALAHGNEGLPGDQRVDYRVGINLGDIIFQDDDIFGDGVNVAARLEALAEPGGICISGTSYDQVSSKLDCGFEFLGEKQVKNIQEPVRVYKVVPEGRNALKSAVASSAAAAGRRRASVVVHPFRLFSESGELKELAEAFCEDLEIAFAQLRNLQVLASSQLPGKTGIDVPQAAEDIATGPADIDYQIQGSIRPLDDQLRINVQIINLHTGFNVWAEKYQCSAEEFAAGAEPVVEALAASAQTQIVLHEGTREKDFHDERERVDHLVSKAWSVLYGLTPEALDHAGRLCDAALSLDPRSARAYQVQACVNHHQYYMGFTSTPDVVLQKGLEQISRAIDINDDDEYSHWVRGNVLIDLRKTNAAFAAFDRSREINPSFSLAVASYGTACAWAGKSEEAIRLSQQALSANPRDPSNFFRFNSIAVAHFAAGDFEQSLHWAERTIERRRAFLVPHLLRIASSTHLDLPDLSDKLAEMETEFPAVRAIALEMVPYTRLEDQQSLRDGLERAFG
ncbi:MAG: adenylate/guanylate cyclase domain-containing protein [Rhizobiaceae bacterium]